MWYLINDYRSQGRSFTHVLANMQVQKKTQINISGQNQTARNSPFRVLLIGCGFEKCREDLYKTVARLTHEAPEVPRASL